MTPKQIQERINAILERQKDFAKMIQELQGILLEELLGNYVEIISNNSSFETTFNTFNNRYHLDVVNKLLEDVYFILNENENYFIEEVGVSKIEVVKVKETLLKEFGIVQNEIGTGFFNNVFKSTLVKENVRAFLAKQGRNLSTSNVKDSLRDFVKGNGEIMGVYERFYYKSDDYNPQSIFDTYQKADRMAQNTYSEELGLDACMYLGGIIDSTRPFCLERNGKVFLRSEVESWKTLTFAGKPKTGYIPFEDAGGYRCRHHFAFISNATAMRLDKTLKINRNGKLYRAN